MSTCVGLWFTEPAKAKEDEIDGWLVLLRGTIKYLVGQFKVEKTTIQHIWNYVLKSYYNDDTEMFASTSRKFLAGVLSNKIVKK